VLTPPTIPGELSNFANCVRDELSVFCEKQDGHAFRPHLTLLRFPRDYKVAIHIPAGLQESQLLPIHQKLKEISLVESHLGSRNDSYVRLAGFELIERLP
jgi:2'-5' RNA ligase